MTDALDLFYQCSPVFAVLWSMIYFHHRMERMARAHYLACERLADEIRRIDAHAAVRTEIEIAPLPTPPVPPPAPLVQLPLARVVKGHR